MIYQYDIKHIPGKELNTAGFLSRWPLPNTGISELQEETEAYINLIVSHLPATDRRLTEIKEYQDNRNGKRKFSKVGERRSVWDLEIYQFIIYCSTPMKIDYSPAVLLMERALRTTVPIPLKQLQPKLPKQ